MSCDEAQTELITVVNRLTLRIQITETYQVPHYFFHSTFMLSCVAIMLSFSLEIEYL